MALVSRVVDSLITHPHSPFRLSQDSSIVGVRSAADTPSLLGFRRPVASQAYSTGVPPGLTTGVGLPEPATRPIEAEYRAILGPYLLHSRDIAGIFDPGTCAPIYLDWQSGEPSPRRDSILGSPVVLILTNFAVCRMPDII